MPTGQAQSSAPPPGISVHEPVAVYVPTPPSRSEPEPRPELLAVLGEPLPLPEKLGLVSGELSVVPVDEPVAESVPLQAAATIADAIPTSKVVVILKFMFRCLSQ
jgi:hypothetical protein